MKTLSPLNKQISAEKQAFDSIIKSLGTHVAISGGESYLNQVSDAIDKATDSLKKIANTSKEIHYIKGDLAEIWHTETANISAVAKGNKTDFFVAPRDPGTVDISGKGALEYLKYQ